MLKAIFVRKLFIWPRWEASVRDVLDRSEIDVSLLLCQFQAPPCSSWSGSLRLSQQKLVLTASRLLAARLESRLPTQLCSF